MLIANNALKAVRAVNATLKAGQPVYLTDNGFVVDITTFAALLDNYTLFGTGINQKPVGERLKPYKIYSPNYYVGWIGHETPSEAVNALDMMGFDLVSSIEDADVVVLDNALLDETFLGLRPTLILGGDALHRLEDLGVLPEFDPGMFENGWSNEGLFKVKINTDLPLSSGYLPNDYFYSTSGTWIAGVPTGFDQLVSILNEDFFISGWWQGFEALGGKTMTIDGQYNGFPLFIYTGNPMNRLHPHALYRWVSNAIFRGVPTAFEAIITQEPQTEGIDALPTDTNEQPAFQGDVQPMIAQVSDDFVEPTLTKISQGEIDDLDASTQMPERQLPSTGAAIHPTAAAGIVTLIWDGSLFVVKRREVE